MEFALDNAIVKKSEFLRMTSGKTITIEKVGKLFDSHRYKKSQFIIRVSCEEEEVESKWYISPVLKDKDTESLYFGTKSFLHKLLIYALTGDYSDRGVTVTLDTVREALEGNDYTITYDFNGKHPKIYKVE